MTCTARQLDAVPSRDYQAGAESWTAPYIPPSDTPRCRRGREA